MINNISQLENQINEMQSESKSDHSTKGGGGNTSFMKQTNEESKKDDEDSSNRPVLA